MFSIHVVMCPFTILPRPSVQRRQQVVRTILTLLAIIAGNLLAGCAALLPRLEGQSGPVAWQATDLRVIERQVSGNSRDLYAFTLVLKETQNTGITFTQADYHISQPDVNAAGVSSQNTISWKLQPQGELRQAFSFYWYCDIADCEYLNLRPAPWYDIVLTGEDDNGHPLRVAINLKLPQNPPRPTLVSTTAPSDPSPPPATSVSTRLLASQDIPIQTGFHTPYVNALLNEKEYVRLLLDTGATFTALTPETATRLRIRPPDDAPQRKATVVGGQQVEFSFTELGALRVGQSVVENQRIGVTGILPEAPLVDGILGGDILHQFNFTLNYATSRLHLRPAGTSPLSPPEKAVTVGIKKNRPWIKARLNSQHDVTFLLDTGSTLTLLRPDIAKRIGLNLPSKPRKRTISVFGGRKITVPLAELASLAVGEAEVKDFSIGVFEAMPKEPTVAGLLGGDFLHHFIVTLDYANRQLWLE